ncbi:phytoene/squalene synthase family protein [Salimicrobium halophilum]|uniref:Phytoene synthase n=1 Tax=Salimicrobium halophilum TaxID=86666 RepID=A0A1G8RN31_9BACI|nr:phytoene/squalene synthase family protein [Salimicrobium halophilum]SDJ18474.1 phytoene synthase [Salimicrobium halophilum]
MDIDQAYEQCHSIIKKYSKTFAKAFSYLPKDRKRAVWAVYGFCRYVDDVVDEGDAPAEHLREIKEELYRFERDESVPERPFWVALHDVRSKFHIRFEPYYDMIKGQEMDLSGVEIETEDELLEYSYNVASTVGLMLLPILAPGRYEVLKEDAIHLGYAMQLTNILRDIGEDLEKGRVYIPKETYESFGYTKKQLEHREITPAFIDTWEYLAQKAENYYSRAMSTISYYPLTSRLPVKGAAYLYMSILDAVRREEYDVFTKRAFVEEEEKKRIIAKLQ